MNKTLEKLLKFEQSEDREMKLHNFLKDKIDIIYGYDGYSGDVFEANEIIADSLNVDIDYKILKRDFTEENIQYIYLEYPGENSEREFAFSFDENKLNKHIEKDISHRINNYLYENNNMLINVNDRNGKSDKYDIKLSKNKFNVVIDNTAAVLDILEEYELIDAKAFYNISYYEHGLVDYEESKEKEKISDIVKQAKSMKRETEWDMGTMLISLKINNQSEYINFVEVYESGVIEILNHDNNLEDLKLQNEKEIKNEKQFSI